MWMIPFYAVLWVASKLCDLANALGYPCAMNTTKPMDKPAS
jgi:hypothetical protein